MSENISSSNLDDVTTGSSDLGRSKTARFEAGQPAETDSTPPADDPRIGTIVAGRYQLQRLLGVGGMGAVYLGEHMTLHKRVAVKFLRAEFTQTAEIVTRFEREAVAAAKIDHPNVVAVHDFGKDADGSAFFVLDFIDGITLGALLETEKTLSPERVLAVAKDVGAALGAAHSKGIVHRDLKPDNVVLVQRPGESDLAKVIDFGIAKDNSASSRAGEKGAPLTQAGMIFGTPEYMAPEQALGADVDHRVDLYALGVLLFESLAGQRPYMADDVVSLLGMQLSAEIPKISTTTNNPQYAIKLDDFFTKALAKQRNNRFDSASEMVAAFQEALEAKPPVAKSPDASQSSSVTAVTSAVSGVPSAFAAHRESILDISRVTVHTLASATQEAWKTASAEPTQRKRVLGVGAAVLAFAVLLGPVRHKIAHRALDPLPEQGTDTPTHVEVPPNRSHAVNSLMDRVHNLVQPANNSGTTPIVTPVVTARPSTGNLSADLDTFRADPRMHVLLDRRSLQSVQSKIDALEQYRLTDTNPLLIYTLGTLYAQQGARGEALMLERFAEALGARPDLATDDDLVDGVLSVKMRSRSPNTQRADALLHGPLESVAPRRVFARIARDRSRRERERSIALLTREFPASIDSAAIPLIDLYRARNCNQLRVSVEALSTAGDARALDTLQTLPRPPARCGWSECNPCLGTSVDDAIRAIQARQPR